MSTIQRAATLGILVVGSMGAEASNAVAQDVATTISPGKAVSPSVVYHRDDWVVDMRRGDGDPRRHTCLSGVFARDGAYYPFYDHVDDGSLQHVDRFFCDGRGGYYHQRGFIWMRHGEYRESTSWSHYRQACFQRARRGRPYQRSQTIWQTALNKGGHNDDEATKTCTGSGIGDDRHRSRLGR